MRRFHPFDSIKTTLIKTIIQINGTVSNDMMAVSGLLAVLAHSEDFEFKDLNQNFLDYLISHSE
jgi:hypothetical protein